METNAKPATSLPWHAEEFLVGTQEHIAIMDDDSLIVSEVWPYISDDKQNHAYIVTACNNFPLMVEALRTVAGCVGDDKAGWILGTYEMGMVRTLLSQLGEA